MHRLTSKETDWTWGEAVQYSFEQLKGKLVAALVLGYPDPSKQYILDTDVCGFGVRLVLFEDKREKNGHSLLQQDFLQPKRIIASLDESC